MLKFAHNEVIRRFRKRFERLYGPEIVDRCMQRLRMVFGSYGVGQDPHYKDCLWNESDVVTITYADMVRQENKDSLPALKRFFDSHLQGVINTVHILPFFPYSSDDGFSVIDYREVKDEYGDWRNVEALGENFNLMFDLVLNHCSRRSSYFKDYINGVAPGRHFFIPVEPETDLSEVVRPRSLPLLTTVQTRRGERHIWSTFSEDQMDLDFANPDVLFEFIDIMLFYVSKGCRILRLDAIAYLWKKIGTSCIHLDETHEVVKLFRDVLDVIAPDVIILTETNVPHEENISYFGHGDEAHMVYQFSLPPLTLHALHTGNASYLSKWAGSLGNLRPGCTYFNFTASHDGVGVRPLSGLIPDSEIDELVKGVKERGGQVSTKSNSDGTESPYELNISYFDALGDGGEVTEKQIARFLCSQSIALAVRGVPGIYFHSLTATRNYQEGVTETGRARTINRRKWMEGELNQLLEDREQHHHVVFEEYCRRIRIRTACKAFHPDAPMTVLDLGSELFAFERNAMEGGLTVICLHNVTDSEVSVKLDRRMPALGGAKKWQDMLDDEAAPLAAGKTLTLKPYQVAWLRPVTKNGRKEKNGK